MSFMPSFDRGGFDEHGSKPSFSIVAPQGKAGYIQNIRTLEISRFSCSLVADIEAAKSVSTPDRIVVVRILFL